MLARPLLFAATSTLSVGLLVSTQAYAHIELLEPVSRYPRSGNKSCPCGEGDSNRQCDVPAEESSDPNRSTDPAMITTYEVGSTITLHFDEYIGHAGRFRVAFDDDGADLVDFNNNVLRDLADPIDNPGLREIEVTLPDTPCDNCTLQLIQAMHGDTVNPVLDPAPLSTYYACADIVLVPRGQLTEAPTSGEMLVDDDGLGDGLDGELGAAASDGGCSASPTGSSNPWGALASLGVLLGLGLRRRVQG